MYRTLVPFALLFFFGCDGSIVPDDPAELGQDSSALDAQRQTVRVRVMPGAAQIGLAGTVQLSATVTGTSDSAVRWTASGGDIDDTGLFTAPNVAGQYAVTASSLAQESATTTITVFVGSAGEGVPEVPEKCFRSGEALVRATLRVDAYAGLRSGRNGIHEVFDGAITTLSYDSNPAVFDLHEVHVAMNVASDRNSSGLPQEIPLHAGDTLQVQGIYIPQSQADGPRAVVHFTHEPCGYVTIEGATYQ